PAVTVTAENIATKNVRTTITGDTGDYVFTLLPIGAYTVKIELSGFQTVTSKVELATGDRARVDARMELGTVSENLIVTGESPLLQTDSATVSTLIDQKTVQDAPIPGRNIIRMVQLVPGANEGALSSLANGTRPDERRQTSSVSINGVNDVLNNQLVDGMDNNERSIGTVAIKPSIDAIAEVRVQTNMYTAETGRTLGGVINIITKSGGNAFHGSAFEFARHEKFDSRQFFAQGKPENRQNQFGGSLGGPLRRDRTFFFVDYEGYRIKQGVPSVVTVPTAKMRAGDFSELSTQIYDAQNGRTAFAGNVIPAGRFDPIAVKYMQLYPAPNGPGLANNFSYTNNRTQDNDAFDARVDHRFDDRNTVFARYSYNKTDTLTPSLCPPTLVGGKSVDPTCIVGGAATGNYAGPNYTTAHNVTGNYVRVLNATSIMEVKASYSKPDILSLGPNNNSNYGDLFGVPNANTGAQETSGLPLMEMRPTTIAALGETQWVPLQIYNRTKQFAGSFSNTRGAHNLRIGAGVVMRSFGVLQSNSAQGLWGFDSTPTNSGATGLGGNAFASFLLGFPTDVRRLYTPSMPHYHTNEPSVFFQDDWRAKSWLTVNLGLRYDVFTPLTEEDDHLSNFVPSLGKLLVAGENGVGRTAGVNTDYSDIGPRVGFSASLPSQMVLRGGYGLAYYPNNKNAGAFMKNPPFTANYGPNTSLAQSGGAPNLLLKDGLPAVVFADPSQPTGNVIGTDINFKADRAQQFNLMLEKEFSGNVVTVGYVGSRGDRLQLGVAMNYNLAPAGAGGVNQRRPYFSQYPQMANVNILSNVGKSTYNAWQFVFNRRYRDGLTATTHYTWSHSRQYTPVPWDFSKFEWGDTQQFDIRHRFVATASYELPWGKELTGVAHGFLSNWQVNLTGYL
ncbi:MAG: carboxypeptidase regulatory-like domain-containing protein, partial [Vicinamibacterales bacterium]